MIQSILVFPRKRIANLIQTDEPWNLDSPWILISIYSDTSGPLIVDKSDIEILSYKGCAYIKSYDFHDTTKKYSTYLKKTYPNSSRKYKLFSKRQARDIVSYINEFKKQDKNFTLVIHCEAGVSRSGAVGIFACRYLGLDEKIFRSSHPAIKPNPFVYDTLCEVSKMKDDFERFWTED